MEDIDYIAVNQQTMVYFHGKYTFLENNDKLNLCETKRLINSDTDRTLTEEELNYVLFHDECYENTINIELTSDILQRFFTWYLESRRAGITIENLRNSPNTTKAYNIVRYYLTATDFQSHFRSFDPTNSTQERYERNLAEKALLDSDIAGRWLLRHSSKNRPVSKEAQDILQKLGYRYYALSYSTEDKQIYHILITHKVGKGWYSGTTWYTNFLDVLESTLVKHKLSFDQRISGYIQDE